MTTGPASRAPWSHGEEGFTLLELLVSTAIVLVLMGAIFTLVDPSQHTFRAQPEVSDMQQRMRVAAEALFRGLLMAGAGPYHGATTGSLANFFAPVLPYRVGQVSSDPADDIFYRSDAMTLVYVPTTAAQTTIGTPMPTAAAVVTVETRPGCPEGGDPCGFKAGMSLLVFDADGAWESFDVIGVQGPGLHLEHRGQQLMKSYPAGARIVQAEYHTYYHCGANACPGGGSYQLRHYDGLHTDLPLVDNVVEVRFRYYGDPEPPTAPRAAAGAPTCVVDAGGAPILPRLEATDGSLVELTAAILTDGPWCPTAAAPGSNRYDADLLRLKKVRVSIRVQAADAGLRGLSPALFHNRGTATVGQRFAPDYRSTFDVSPRNLNLSR
jgi:prepilin-type N-terminal cleavage/methylation domain-containing protein